MRIALKTGPTKKPVTLKQAKEHLSVAVGQTNHDDMISRIIGVSTAHIEQLTQRSLMTQTWYTYLDTWAGVNPNIYFYSGFYLPRGSLQSVTAITYKDTDGSESTWDAGEYIVDTDKDPGRVVLDYGETWPTENLYPSNPIRIEYVCGYGDDQTDVPDEIRHAILITISDLFQNREDDVFGTIRTKLNTIESLIAPFRMWAF